jgi:hypothetical protein
VTTKKDRIKRTITIGARVNASVTVTVGKAPDDETWSILSVQRVDASPSAREIEESLDDEELAELDKLAEVARDLK